MAMHFTSLKNDLYVHSKLDWIIKRLGKIWGLQYTKSSSIVLVQVIFNKMWFYNCMNITFAFPTPTSNHYTEPDSHSQQRHRVDAHIYMYGIGYMHVYIFMHTHCTYALWCTFMVRYMIRTCINTFVCTCELEYHTHMHQTQVYLNCTQVCLYLDFLFSSGNSEKNSATFYLQYNCWKCKEV